MATKNILVVEDEEDIRDLICQHLAKEGFQPQGVPSAESALDEVRKRRPDAILLDLMLPDMQGNELCRVLKGSDWSAGIPIIMVSAKGEEIDRLLGFELGADDYITKPFSLRELTARLRAVVRRARQIPASAELPPYEGHHLFMDFSSYEVRVRGEPVNLSLIEFRLLKHFVTHPHNVYSRAQLLDLVWGRDTNVMPRTVDVHIQKLRARIEEDPRNPKMILTVRGAGYKFRPGGSDRAGC